MKRTTLVLTLTLGLALDSARTAHAGAAKRADAGLPQEENSLGMELVLIPAGQFVMGSPAGEWGRGGNEAPQRQVTITRPFYMSRGETTNAQFMEFINATTYNPIPLFESDGQFLYYLTGGGTKKYEGKPESASDNPVLWVSWYSAIRFCNWLSEKEGKTPVYEFRKPPAEGQPASVRMERPYDGGYRLPTEAEWEYAARAGTTTAFSFGPDDKLYSQFAFAHYFSIRTGYRSKTVASTSHKPNPWGLYQMHGNVFEWCWDWYRKVYDKNVTIDPLGPERGELRVERGGAAKLPPCFGRSAARMMDPSVTTRYDLGFRVVRNR